MRTLVALLALVSAALMALVQAQETPEHPSTRVAVAPIAADR